MASAKNRRTKKIINYVAGPKPPHYNARNTHLNKDGEVVVHGKVVCRPKGAHVRSGSFFTPKGGKPIMREREDGSTIGEIMKAVLA